MRIFGYEFSITKAVPTPTQPAYQSGWLGNWWWPVIREPFSGAWQNNMELRAESIVSYFAVYACVSLISTDIGKLGLILTKRSPDRLWLEVEGPSPFWPVLRKPNHFQTRSKFLEQWLISKLLHGNTYVIKERDQRGIVVRLYILDSTRVRVLVAPDGSVFYELAGDNLAGLPQSITAPASEIIHDVCVPLYHPLCGVSPLMAAALPVAQGLSIQRNSSKFFANGSRPGGILSAPGPIGEEHARQLKNEWEQNFTGENSGRVAIVGDGLKYESLGMKAEEAQLIEQLKWTAENVASVFHVPTHMIGLSPMPAYDTNIEARIQQYYSQCLQTHIKSIESLLEEGLGLPEDMGVDFDLEDLLRMDTKTKMETTGAGVRAAIFSPNEARAKFNYPPVPGGEQPFIQQQNFPLQTAAEQTLTPPAQPSTPTNDDDETSDNESEPLDVDRILAISRLYH